MGLSITPWQRDFFRVLNALQTTVDYDDYIRRAGFKVRNSAESRRRSDPNTPQRC